LTRSISARSECKATRLKTSVSQQGLTARSCQLPEPSAHSPVVKYDRATWFDDFDGYAAFSSQVWGSKFDVQRASPKLGGSKFDVQRASPKLGGSKFDVQRASPKLGGSKYDVQRSSPKFGGSKVGGWKWQRSSPNQGLMCSVRLLKLGDQESMCSVLPPNLRDANVMCSVLLPKCGSLPRIGAMGCFHFQYL
jgi:hypothetical protein